MITGGFGIEYDPKRWVSRAWVYKDGIKRWAYTGRPIEPPKIDKEAKMNDFVSQYRKTIKEISEIVQSIDFDVEEIRTLTADAFYLAVEISAASLGIESVDESESTTITLVYPDGSSRQVTLHPAEVISNTSEAEDAIKRIMEK